MSSEKKESIGKIGWIDLTVPEAVKIKEFYQSVVGWESAPVSMGDYEDYIMNQPGTENAIAGICHKLGVNKTLPSQWLIYITVTDVDISAEKCTAQGGKILLEPKNMGSHGRFCIIQDPAGAVAALFAPAK